MRSSRWMIGVAAAAMTLALGARAQTPAGAPAPASPASPPASEGPRPLSEGIAATVNDDIISTYDLRQRVRFLIISTGVQPTEQNLPEIEREALRGLVDERLEMQEIESTQKRQKDLHLLPTPKEVDEEIADYAKQFRVTPKQLIATLKAAGVDEKTLRDQITVSIAWHHYVGARFRESVHVGPEQVNAALKQIDAAASKPQYHVSEVFIDASRAGGQAAAEDGARQLVAQLRQGAPFQAVARQFSALPSAANGGDAGWLASGQLPAALEKVVATMRPGDISDPIPTTDGAYIVQLREKRAGASAVVIDLKQAVVQLAPDAPAADVAAAEAKLVALRDAAGDCAHFEAAAAKSPGVVAGDVGEVDPNDLSPEFRQAIDGLKVGQIGGPVRSKAGLHLLGLCGRRAGGAQAPTRADIENRLYGEQLSMIERRFLRDLRNSAAIESR